MTTQVMLKSKIQPRPEFAGILRNDQFFGSGESRDTLDQLNGWFDKLALQSGWEITPTTLLMLCVCGVATLGGAIYVVQENLLTTAIAAIIGGVTPIVTAMVKRSRRQKQMLQQMPGMVGELARAARTGRSLEQCFELVANDTLSPLGDELKRCARKLRMGIGLGSAIRDLPARTGLISLSVLAMALTVHQQTGGDLVDVLERLSRTIRDRLTYLGRLRAATTAGRATAILMLVVPPGVLAFFIFRDPEYFANLMDARWGRNTMLLAVFLQIVGSVWILRILKRSHRT